MPNEPIDTIDPPIKEESKWESKNESQKDQFIISGNNNTVTIPNDASVVKMLDQIREAQNRKDEMQFKFMQTTQEVVKNIMGQVEDYMVKKAASHEKMHAPAPSASVTKSPKRKTVVKKEKASPKKRK